MNAIARLEGHRVMEQLLHGFLIAVRRCRANLVDLDRGEIHAMCLSALSVLGGGAAAVLLLPGQERQLQLDLCSSALPCEADRLVARLTPADFDLLAREPERLGQVEGFARMLRRAFGDRPVFSQALVAQDRVCGALILPPPKDRVFAGEDLELLSLAAAQINVLLQTAEEVAALIRLTLVDDLTGLYNYRYLNGRLSAEIARASRHGHPLSLIHCSVDDFDGHQQRRGRPAAEALLRQIGDLLKAPSQVPGTEFCFRLSDIPVRYSGGEFMVILPETPKEGAATKAERLRGFVEALRERITLSIGVATFPEDGADGTGLLSAADRALLRARELGQNLVRSA